MTILATVVSVEKKCSDSVVVRLESDELRKAGEVVSTGLDCEQSRKSEESGLEVTCKADPRAKTGDKVPVIVNSELKELFLLDMSFALPWIRDSY